jgi:hypothetical protein
VEAHTAMFQLRRRLERLKIYHPEDEPSSGQSGDDASAALADGEIVEVNAEGHPDKPEGGNRRPRARFGRRRTHNEELCVATCGLIYG